MPISQFIDLKCSELVSELEARAPLLLKALCSIVARNDHRNQSKRGASHFPGICMAAAIILKERNRDMCGTDLPVDVLLPL